MYSVTLSGLLFHAPLGIYPQEQILGNDLQITVSVTQKEFPEGDTFLDYEKIYFLIEKEVKIPETTLENLLRRILAKIEILYPKTGIHIEIRKVHPPFGGRADYASISWNKE